MSEDHADSVVQIDELNLDKECIKLPGDYLKYARLAADAKRDVDEQSSELKVVHADLSKEVRAAPEDFGLDKLTETGLASIVVTLPRYVKTARRLRDAEHTYQIAQAVVWALEHKKRSLTLLVDLHGMGYFSDVKMSREGKDAVEEMTKRKVRRPRDDEE